MHKKIIFFDIDGTLLASKIGHVKPSEKTILTLQQLKNEGALLFITSGRPYCLISQEIRKLNFNGYITSNGMCTIINNRIVHERSLEDNLIESIKSYAITYRFGYHLETPECIYVSTINKEQIDKYFEKYNLPMDVQSMNIKKFTKGFNKIVIYLTNDKDIDRIIKEFSMLRFYKIEDCVYEAVYDFVNKGSAIKELMEEANFTEYKTFAFGDGVNDIEMMQAVDVSIAMGEAHPTLLPHVKYQTTSVSDEGIYAFFKEYNEKNKHD